MSRVSRSGGCRRSSSHRRGQIVAVRVAAMMVRHAKGERAGGFREASRGMVLPEIEYVPG